LQDAEGDYDDKGAMLFQKQCTGAETDPRLAGGLCSSQLYLDTCTTNNQCTNRAHLKAIHTVKKPLVMHTNAGSLLSNQKGLLGSILFWLNLGGLASVVALRTLEKLFTSTMMARRTVGLSSVKPRLGK
jgi:hypothetical protein